VTSGNLRLFVLALLTPTILLGQKFEVHSDIRYGGEPPWGLEKPVHISGKVHRGERFEQAIGRGLSFYLEPTEQGWHIGVNDAGGADMMLGFSFEACHGGEIYDAWRRINIDEPRVFAPYPEVWHSPHILGFADYQRRRAICLL
jgi:hypothetical protein